MVQTRSKRARVYDDRRAAVNARQGYKEATELWGEDGLLPDGIWILIPRSGSAFATFNDIVVSHGGLTLDEVVVPLVTITA